MSIAVKTIRLGRTFISGSGQPVIALNELDIEIPNGSFVVIKGPSGCGKSTLLNLIGMLDSPSSGTLSVEGVELTSLTPVETSSFRREYIGFLFQDAGLIEPMNVYDSICMPLAYRETLRSERQDRVRSALELVGLVHRQQASVSELSGGERQRIGLARALVARPKVLICDEPTASLDEANSHDIADLLSRRAQDGLAVICSSHDPIVISRADMVVSLIRGRVAEIK